MSQNDEPMGLLPEIFFCNARTDWFCAVSMRVVIVVDFKARKKDKAPSASSNGPSNDISCIADVHCSLLYVLQ